MLKEPKTKEQLTAEAIEFLQGRHTAVRQEIIRLEEYLKGIEKEIIKLGGFVPSDTPLYELVERRLRESFRMIREDELISDIVSQTPWLSVRNPEAQIKKAITQSCKRWTAKSTKFFRCSGWVGRYQWYRWIMRTHPNPDDLVNLIVNEFKVTPESARGLAETLIQSGALMLYDPMPSD